PFDTETVRIGVAEVNDRCVARNSGGCDLCGEACPYGAITFDDRKRPVVDANRCNGCGVCENVCPALVLRSYLGGKERGIVIKTVEAAQTHVGDARKEI
ncbi:MAG: 4Fe-4S binding protein, partial [Acidobacteriota bacterium]|nr:4Fe-4S binding protein [Acidobacteriota bacterium]